MAMNIPTPNNNRDNIIMTDTAYGAGTADPSEGPEFTPKF